MKFLVTAKMEFYQLIEADSEEEVLDYVESGGGSWRQTRDQSPENIKIRQTEIETTGVEVIDKVEVNE